MTQVQNFDDKADLNQLYLAFVLDEESRNEVLHHFPPRFSRVICHHVTIEYNLTTENLVQYFNCIGKGIRVSVIGEFVGEGVDGVAVLINGTNARADGSFYHITTSVEPPHAPVESNQYKESIYRIRGFMPLTGSFQLLHK